MPRPGRGFPAAGIVAALAVAAAACAASPPPPLPPSSPLTSATPLTCAGSAASCAAPGTLRWSQPLSGTHKLDGGGGTLLDLWTAQAAGPGDLEPGGVTSAPGLIVYQRAGLVIGIDPATGRRKWTDRLGQGLLDGYLPLIGDGEVAAVAAPLGQPGDARVLNATTGAASKPIALPCGAKTSDGCDPPEMLAVTAGDLVVLAASGIEDLNAATGAVRWHAPADLQSRHAVIGSVLYADRTPRAIQRTDLLTGAAMSPLPLEPSLHGGTVLSTDARTGALLISTGTAVARLNPGTGRAIWIRGLSGESGSAADAFSYVKIDPASSPPSVLVFDFPSRTVRYDYRLRAVSLATGATEFTLDRSQAVAHRYRGVTAWDSDNWSVYGSAVLSQSQNPGPKTNDFTVSRLAGLDPANGRTVWQGPRSDADQTVLAETAVGPHLVIVLGCAPGSITRPSAAAEAFTSAICHQPRLYAINA